MAKITITIEDLPGGKVKVESNPSFEQMCQLEISGQGLTSAHGYAFLCVNEIQKESKRMSPTKVLIPKVGH